MTVIQEKLFLLQDTAYRDFHCKLVPTVEKERIIGVRIPVLRKLSAEINNTKEAEAFLAELPHKYYEENNLHAFLIERIRDYDEAVDAVNTFLPYVDNWATCDSMSPKVFKKHKPELREQCLKWLKKGDIYSVRFGIEMLMSWFLDDDFYPEVLNEVAGVNSAEYYVNMMQAWFFATALAKQYDSTVVYLEENRLDLWTHNKTIRKAVESYRITDEQKAYLRTLARK